MTERKAKILVVDDEPSQRKMLKANLSLDGYQVFEAEDDAPSEPTPTMPFFLENALAESAATAQEEEPEPPPVQDAPNKESAAIDEETFKQVMSWTIARFKQQRGKKEEMRLGVEQLPSALAGMIKRKGLNENVIEYLMEQIVLRCKETMSRKKAGGQ